MRQQELRDRVDRLARIDQHNGHAGHNGGHAVDQCRYCARWVAALLDVWEAADEFYGPRSVALGVRAIAKREATRPISAP